MSIFHIKNGDRVKILKGLGISIAAVVIMYLGAFVDLYDVKVIDPILYGIISAVFNALRVWARGILKNIETNNKKNDLDQTPDSGDSPGAPGSTDAS